MALVPVTMLYDTKAVIDATGLLNGQILYTTDQIVNKIYADVLINGTLTRIEIGGTNEIDTVLNQESGHAIANSAVAKLAQTVHTNFIDPTLYIISPSYISHGITITNNGDGTFTMSGTSDSDVGGDGWIAFNLVTWGGNPIIMDGVDKVRFCGTPSGLNGKAKLQIADSNTSVTWYNDTGDGTTITTIDGKITLYTLRIEVQPNTTFPNTVFKPMLTTDLSATYDDFVQYSGDGELNENVASLYNNLATTNSNVTALDTKVGAQSLLPTPSQSVTQNINTLKTEINQINSNLSELSLSDTQTFYAADYNQLYGNARITRKGRTCMIEIHGFSNLAANYENTVLDAYAIRSSMRPKENVTFTLLEPTGVCYRLTLTNTGALLVYPYGSTSGQNNVLDFNDYLI